MDTFTAFNVCEILRNLARTGRTVIATIHQPSSETFQLFDDLCLLAEGRVMYWGPVQDVVPYFAGVGYQCPMYTNPADYLFMNILNTEKAAETMQNDKSQAENEDRQRIVKLLGHWSDGAQAAELAKLAARPPNQTTGYSKLSLKFRSSFQVQFLYLLKRAGRNALRNKFIVRVKLAQTLFIGLLLGLIYLDTPSKTLDQQIQVC